MRYLEWILQTLQQRIQGLGGDKAQRGGRSARPSGGRLHSRTARAILEPLHAGSAGAWMSPRVSFCWRKEGNL